MRHSLFRALALAGALALTTAATAVAQGVVTGRVTDSGTNEPIVGARVQVIGTNISGQTNADGRYRFPNVPGGNQTVRVVALGYAAVNQVVTVTVGGTASSDFSLALTPFSLDEFVVTATGEQSRKEIGNAVSTVDVSDLARTAPIANMGDLLAARAPSVQVLPSNLTGGGSRVRIRGNSSMSLSNNPIYIVDGVRIWDDVNSSSIGIGGTNPARINDLNPEDIESIDVVRGPSAATLYGTEAANGVIVIKTKKGKAGRPVWNAYVEQGFIQDNNQYPIAYRGWRNGSTVSNATQCFISQVIAGSCVQDSVSSFNLFDDPDASPNGTGHRQQYGLQVSGGTDNMTYFVSGEWEDEIGYLQMPSFFADFYREKYQTTEIPTEVERPNALTRSSFRVNLTSQISQKFDVAVNTGFTSSTQRLPQTDNNTTGLLSNGYGGPGFKGNMVSHTSGQPLRENLGYRLYTPDEFFSERTIQDVNRTILSGTTNFRPNSWLSFRAVTGMDFTSRVDTDSCPRAECPPFGTSRPIGYKADNRTTNFVWTGDVSGTARYSLTDNIQSRTTVGWQYVKNRFNRNGAYAEDLPPGATTVSAGAVPSASESTAESATLGYFAEQWFGWNDKVFLTLAMRTDKNNAFGADFARVYYPKASLSWVMSDEGFMSGRPGWLTSLRLRGAYGASGRQPGANDALAFFTPGAAVVDQVEVPTLVVSAIGNPGLKPEKTSEVEGGFDIGLFNNRLNVELTFWSKFSSDALVFRPLPPSFGAVSGRFENIGDVSNKGIEAVINGVLIDNQSTGWDFTIGADWLSNKITSLGGEPDIIGTTTSHRLGYPINGWWQRPYTWEDTNGDGLIARSEVVVGDTNVFVGYPLPRGEFNLFTGFEMFGRKLRLQANVNSKVGGTQLNGTERIRCQSRANCRGVIDPTAPLWEQARAVAVRETGTGTQYGYMEKTDFIRLRELSATWTMPDAFANALRASRVTLTAGARNLFIITDYTGIDPEAGYFGSDSGVQSDFQTAPPPSYFTFRLNVTF